MLRSRWSDDEVKILKTKMALPKEELLKLLPRRTWHAILNKAQQVGVFRRLEVNKNQAKYHYDLTEVEAAYIAGIIDGEGSIAIRRDKGSGTSWYYPCLAIVNTDKNLMSWLHSKLHFSRTHLRKRGKSRQCYLGILSAYRVYSLLKQLLPFLIVKKERAEHTIGFIEQRLQHTHPYSGYTKEEIRLFEKVRILNKLGSA